MICLKPELNVEIFDYLVVTGPVSLNTCPPPLSLSLPPADSLFGEEFSFKLAAQHSEVEMTRWPVLSISRYTEEQLSAIY